MFCGQRKQINRIKLDLSKKIVYNNVQLLYNFSFISKYNFLKVR
jgi:hypothetical protein